MMWAIMLKLLSLTTAYIAVLVAYHIYIPLPEEIKDPWKVRIIFAMDKFIGHLSVIGSSLGLGHRINITRTLSGMFFSYHVTDPEVTVIQTLFDKVKVLITKPLNGINQYPAIIFFHGGGFSLFNAITAELTKRLNAVVVSVDYRLAPEFPFPLPVHDCVSATVHFLKNYAQYDVDPYRIAVVGDSSGGNLATVVSLILRDRTDIPHIKYQVLLYPFLQAFDMLLPSHQQNEEFFFPTRTTLSLFALLYLNEDLSLIPQMRVNNHTSSDLKKSKVSRYVDPKFLPERFTKDNYIKSKNDFGNSDLSMHLQSKLLNPYAFPLMTEDLHGLPPAFILVCQFDTLRDEGLLYAHRLKEAGIKVQEHVVESGIHASINFFEIMEIGENVMNITVEFLKNVL